MAASMLPARASTFGPIRVYGTQDPPVCMRGNECLVMEVNCANESVNDPYKAALMANNYAYAPGNLGQALGIYLGMLDKSEQYKGSLQVLGDPNWRFLAVENEHSPFTTLVIVIPLRRIPEAPLSPVRK